MMSWFSMYEEIFGSISPGKSIEGGAIPVVTARRECSHTLVSRMRCSGISVVNHLD
jgi:hypothetical protein